MEYVNYLKQAKIYIVTDGTKHELDVSSLSVSQTYTEKTYSTKSLHTRNLVEASVIKKANPANFSFSLPVCAEDQNAFLVPLALTNTTFDLYIVTEANMIKVEHCVFSNCQFIISNRDVLQLSLEGEARRVTIPGLADVGQIPGTLKSPTGPLTYLRVNDFEAVIDLFPTTDLIYSVNAEFQSDISWTEYMTVHDGIAVFSDQNTIYPGNFVVQKHIFAGSIGRYLTRDNYSDALRWNVTSPMHIKAGETINGTFCGFDINLNSCAFTSRVSAGDIFTMSHDWRMNYNPANLLATIQYKTL